MALWMVDYVRSADRGRIPALSSAASEDKSFLMQWATEMAAGVGLLVTRQRRNLHVKEVPVRFVPATFKSF